MSRFAKLHSLTIDFIDVICHTVATHTYVRNVSQKELYFHSKLAVATHTYVRNVR